MWTHGKPHPIEGKDWADLWSTKAGHDKPDWGGPVKADEFWGALPSPPPSHHSPALLSTASTNGNHHSEQGRRGGWILKEELRP